MQLNPHRGLADTRFVRSRLFDPRTAIILAMLAGAALLGWLDAGPGIIDSDLFATWGGTLLSPDWAHTFADPAVQAGPLELALAAAARWVGRGEAGFAAVLDVVCTGAFAAVTLVLVNRRTAGLALAAAAAFLLWLPGQAYRGHPAEILIPLLWLLAAREARASRCAVAGAMVGLSGCFELWGVLGVTVLALAPNPRSWLRGAPLAAAIPAAALLPFALVGEFHMFDYHWIVRGGLAGVVLGAGHSFTWSMRLAEGVAVVGLGGAVARSLRSRPEGIWLVPAVTTLTRLVLDPVRYPYYWSTAQVLLAIGLALAVLERRELAQQLRAAWPRVLPQRRPETG